MKEYRAPKGWKLIGTTDMSFGRTDTRQDIFKREERFRITNRNILKLSEEKLIEATDKEYAAVLANHASLLKAYDEKKLKSKALIKKAKALKKKKEKAAAVKLEKPEATAIAS